MNFLHVARYGVYMYPSHGEPFQAVKKQNRQKQFLLNNDNDAGFPHVAHVAVNCWVSIGNL